MKLNNKTYTFLLLVIFPLIIAVGAYYFTNPKTPVYQAKTVYTVVPKNAQATGNYQDLQATNLFMDVIKSWIYSDNIQTELKDKLVSSKFTGWRSLSMQTFEVAVTAPDQATAIVGANTIREIIYREVGKFSQTNSGGFIIYNFSPTSGQVFPETLYNALLGALVGLCLGGFMVLLRKYYPKQNI